MRIFYYLYSPSLYPSTNYQVYPEHFSLASPPVVTITPSEMYFCFLLMLSIAQEILVLRLCVHVSYV